MKADRGDASEGRTRHSDREGWLLRSLRGQGVRKAAEEARALGLEDGSSQELPPRAQHGI